MSQFFLKNTGVFPPQSARYPITPYVVGPVGQAGYQTIQAAINAANTAGGGVVYIQPGSYSENLTLFDSVDLYGTPAVSQNQGQSTTIIGTHTPPLTGHVGFNSICFIFTGSIFSSNGVGSTHLAFLNCESAVQNGYFLDLPNWTGILEIYDNNPSTAGAPFAVNDGGINNSGGATVLVFSAGLGSGTNVMNLSGLTICQGTSFECPVNFSTGANINILDHVFNGAVTLSNNSTGIINSCSFNSGAAAAVTMSSSGNVSILNGIINSSNNPSVAGAGAGILTLGDLTFVQNSSIASTLTTVWVPTKTGDFSVLGTGNGLILPVSTASGGSPQLCNARVGSVTFTGVSIAATATQSFVINNTTIAGASTRIQYTMSGATTGSALTIQSINQAVGSSTIVVTNGTGATTSTANLIFDFIVMN